MPLRFLAVLSLLSISLLALHPTQAGAGFRYSSCCLCILDDSDQKGLMGTQRECQSWLSSASKTTGCTYKETMTRSEALSLHLSTRPSTCDQLHIYGTFHGNSTGTRLPFEISFGAAQHFSAKEVCYDGSSCLLFDNVDEVRACAQQLGEISKCKYRIEANQNIGVTSLNCWRFKPQEFEEASSKLTAVIDGLNFHLEYAECSKRGESCSYADPQRHRASKEDPNSKRCRLNHAITIQRCCLPSRGDSGGVLNGRWGAPGQSC